MGTETVLEVKHVSLDYASAAGTVHAVHDVSFSFSVIFIMHDLSLLLEVADQVAIMYAGRIVETAPQQQLYHQPAHPYT